jgi:hypothetical protein
MVRVIWGAKNGTLNTYTKFQRGIRDGNRTASLLAALV